MIRYNDMYNDHKKSDDMVNHPKHYKAKNGLETIDVIDAFTEGLEGYEAAYVANILKYTCRFKNKNGVEDLEKAYWYMGRLIDKLQAEKRREMYNPVSWLDKFDSYGNRKPKPSEIGVYFGRDDSETLKYVLTFGNIKLYKSALDYMRHMISMYGVVCVNEVKAFMNFDLGDFDDDFSGWFASDLDHILVVYHMDGTVSVELPLPVEF